jgi:hypothetical protein
VYFNFTGPVHLTIGFRLKRPLVVLVKVIGKLRLSSGARNAGVPIDITTGSAMVIHFSAEAQLFSFEATVRYRCTVIDSFIEGAPLRPIR